MLCDFLIGTDLLRFRNCGMQPRGSHEEWSVDRACTCTAACVFVCVHGGLAVGSQECIEEPTKDYMLAQEFRLWVFVWSCFLLANEGGSRGLCTIGGDATASKAKCPVQTERGENETFETFLRRFLELEMMSVTRSSLQVLLDRNCCITFERERTHAITLCLHKKGSGLTGEFSKPHYDSGVIFDINISRPRSLKWKGGAIA